MGEYRHDWRTTKTEVEQCHVLSCSWLLQHDYLTWGARDEAKRGGITFNNILGEPVYSLSLAFRRVGGDELRLSLAQTGQHITLKASPARFGGVRWWFLCPKCDRRAAKLYLPASGYFACRLCHNLHTGVVIVRR